MLAEKLLKDIRADRQELWDEYLKYKKTNGREGYMCLPPDKLKKFINESDASIIQKAIANGLVIEDADKYLKEELYEIK